MNEKSGNEIQIPIHMPVCLRSEAKDRIRTMPYVNSLNQGTDPLRFSWKLVQLWHLIREACTPVCRLCGRYLAILGRPIRITVLAVSVAPTALVGSLIRSSNLPHSLQRGVHYTCTTNPTSEWPLRSDLEVVQGHDFFAHIITSVKSSSSNAYLVEWKKYLNGVCTIVH